jgi:hypothetical protein
MDLLIALVAGAALALMLVAVKGRLASFRAQRPGDYSSAGPVFDPRRHLAGPLVLEGVIYGPTGRVTSRFVAEAEGRWNGDTGNLRETFRYDSGSVQAREWTLRLLPGGRIAATADDVVGTGTGQVEGASVLMRYRLRLPPQAGGHVLDVTDWMYLLENGTVMNRSQFTKFGLTVAELVATIRPAAPGAQVALAAE